MKISLNWLREFVDIPEKYSAQELAKLLTLRTCEVEGFEDERMKFANMVIGKVIKLQPHPNADKLRLADTDIGGQIVQMVCGGKNLAEGMIVAIALPGAIVKWHGSGQIMELRETKIRGEKSFGMICAGEEIGLPDSPPECITDLGELLKSRGLKIQKPGTPLSKTLGLNDVIFEIDNKSLTHRPDLWGHYGIAREFAAFLGTKLKPFAPNISFPTTGKSVKADIADKTIANRFLVGMISEIRIEESPQWLQNRLLSIDIQPVNNIVDITNYVMVEAGYPMHAFDRNVVHDDHFVVRYAKPGEKIMTIDHKVRALAEDDAVVADAKHPLGIAGIMGGVDCEISPSTTEIILEVGNWNHIMIRKTSQRHGLRSDAAQRFEKSLDPVLAELTFKRACEMILKICKGSCLAGPLTDIYINKPKTISVLLNTETVNKKIGKKIPEKEMIAHLKALGFGVVKNKKNVLKISVPSFRATKDINIEDDLVEEISRMHGYEKIAPVLPTLPIKLPHENKERQFEHKIRQIFSYGLGFYETYNYSFYGEDEVKNFFLPPELHLKLQNPLTSDQTHLRISLIPNLLKTTSANIKHKEELKLYEFGNTYIKTDAYFPIEEKFIAAVIVKTGKEIFYEALGACQEFFDKLKVKTRTIKPANVPPYCHPSKCAVQVCNGQEIAIVFEIHPQILNNLNIDKPCAAFEINFTKLAKLAGKDFSYKPLPKYPGIEIDVSVLVPAATEMRTVHELIAKTDQKLISNIALTDLFQDKSLGEGKKSFTFRILLQSPDRTLTNEEMKIAQEAIFKTLQNNKFTIRGLVL